MKKKIAVLMAAATAVTTVAPAVANADTTTYSNQSLQNLVDAAKKALETKYTNNGDGIDAATLKTDDSSLKWEKSRYEVILQVKKASIETKKDQILGSYGDTFAGAYFTAPSTYLLDNFNIADKSNGAASNAVLGSATNELDLIVKDVNGLYNFLEKYSITEGAEINLYVVDKGATSDNLSYRVSESKVISPYTRENAVKLADQVYALAKKPQGGGENSSILKSSKYIKSAKYYVGATSTDISELANEDTSLNSTNITKVEITLYNNTVVKIENGDDALDFKKPLDANKNTISPSDANQDSVLEKIVGFDKLERDKDTDPVKVDVKTGDTVVYQLNPSVEKSYSLPTYYTGENGYTEAGADFVNAFHKFNADTKDDRKALNLDGTSYVLDQETKLGADGAKAKIVKLEKGGYELQLTIPVKDANDTQKKTTLLLKYTSDVQADLAQFKTDLFNNYFVAVAGKFHRLAGTDRYQTAIEISKEAFDGKLKDGKKNYADTVVITGGTALLDGLSAAPLASANNATLLLASPKSGLSQATIDEIGRATDNKLYKKTVYIVGGYNSVPASVDKVLQDKFGAVVIRLAGDDRYATSKQVAERLVYDGNVNGSIFYVGGNGAADAMSVAPVAATYKVEDNKRKVAPILVTRDKALDQQTRNFLMTKVIKAETGKSYVIGGLNSLGTAFYKDASAVAAKPTENGAPIIERLSGADRYATNVKVVNKFYKAVSEADKITTEGLFIASGVTNYLVDAQTAGAFAATKKAPILLAGSKLTDDQIDLLKKPSTATANPFYTAVPALGDKIASNVYQIGGVVSADAMKVVVDKFGL